MTVDEPGAVIDPPAKRSESVPAASPMISEVERARVPTCVRLWSLDGSSHVEEASSKMLARCRVRLMGRARRISAHAVRDGQWPLCCFQQSDGW